MDKERHHNCKPTGGFLHNSIVKAGLSQLSTGSTLRESYCHFGEGETWDGYVIDGTMQRGIGVADQISRKPASFSHLVNTVYHLFLNMTSHQQIGQGKLRGAGRLEAGGGAKIYSKS